MKATANLLFAVSLAAVAGACGGKASFKPELAVEKRELGEIYDCYMGYVKSNERPPTELSQLKPYEAAHAAGFRALRDGKYKVVWGVSDKTDGTVLAYESAATEKGGVVLMADSTVKTMTAEDLKTALARPK
jgi:hypothetical protein